MHYNKSVGFWPTILLSLLIFNTNDLFAAHQDWSYNLSIYEVNVRQYTEEGTFAAFSAHLERLQEVGVGILWFMPIHPIGQKNRLGTLGSYYAVQNYREINPEFGTLDDFKTLVRQIHERGMYVMMDWVANHTSWDNVLTIEHPEWYSTDQGGDFIAPPGTNWSDVIELNYDQQGLRYYMIAAMKFWLQEVGVDGFRCDAVSMVPKDFWRQAIAELKSVKPDILMLAEGDGREWHDVGFDMTYGWGLYGFSGGVLKRIADGTNTVFNLNSYLNNEKTVYGSGSYRMYFTSNHDENSWQGTTEELFGDAAEAFTVLTATCHGMPLIYSGQEAGLNKRLAFFDKDQIPWREHPNTALYRRLLLLKKRNSALWNGDKGGVFQRVLSSNNSDCFGFIREKDDDKIMAAFNLSDEEQSVTLKGAAFIGSYRDVFSEQPITLEANASLTLPAWGYLVYEVEQGSAVGADTAALQEFLLAQNYPNPFNADTKIIYSVAASTETILSFFDIAGHEILKTKVDSGSPASREFIFTAANLPSGIYLYRLQAGSKIATKRMVLLQ
ncbi:MAG: T9SS C-terminal target domain-containing protein [Calditrichaeota bacterium]|nr:MAG: T9SS C-terminal target domain-containing protein [Calditrichota bacterium]